MVRVGGRFDTRWPPPFCRQCTASVFLGLTNTCGNRNACRFCRLKNSTSSTVASGEPPSSTLLQSPNPNPHYMYVPAPAGHQAMGPGGSIWVPEPSSSWQPTANQQGIWAGQNQSNHGWAQNQNQSNQGWAQQGLPMAPSLAELGDLPPTYDEAIATPQEPGVAT